MYKLPGYICYKIKSIDEVRRLFFNDGICLNDKHRYKNRYGKTVMTEKDLMDCGDVFVVSGKDGKSFKDGYVLYKGVWWDVRWLKVLYDERAS